MQNAVRREEKIYAVESAPLCLPRVVIVVLDGAFRASNGGDDDGCDDDIVVGVKVIAAVDVVVLGSPLSVTRDCNLE